jgi:hypothetical protein
VENRNGLIAAGMVTHADGLAERDAALLMLQQKQQGRSRRITVGADKAYYTKDFANTARELNMAPHVTKNDKGRRSSLDRRTTRRPGYTISQSRRWLIEKGFDWLKQNRSAAPGSQPIELGRNNSLPKILQKKGGFSETPGTLLLTTAVIPCVISTLRMRRTCPGQMRLADKPVVP